jgi:N-terminal acetyltransferase B complex non-catalytic subunit
MELFESMDVKHILHDTVGYFVTDHANSLGFYEHAVKLNTSAQSIYHSAIKEVPEMVCHAFKYSTHSKARSRNYCV